jgi:hypothetical protein
MATLIVENGNGLTDSNSYISLDDATSYHAQRGNADWANASEDDQTAALITATESLELLYGEQFMGSLIWETQQALLFPRIDFEDNTGRWILWGTIPSNLAKAQAEIALMVIQETNVFPMQAETQNIASTSLKVDDFESKVNYLTPAQGETFAGFRKVDLLLAPLLDNGKGSNYYFGL